MARPSKLSPAQRAEVARRLVEGDGVRALAREFGVGPATIMRLSVSEQPEQVRNVAEQVAKAQTALDALPTAQQYRALSLAEKLRNISGSMAAAAELGAKTAHRLHALANGQAAKIDDTDPLKDREALQGVAALLKIGNEAGVLPSNLISASKDAVAKANSGDQEDKPAPIRERLGLEDWKKAHGLA